MMEGLKKELADALLKQEDLLKHGLNDEDLNEKIRELYKLIGY